MKAQHPVADAEELEWYLTLDLDQGSMANNFYFVAWYLIIAGQEDQSLAWIERCASSPQRYKLTTALAGAEVLRRGQSSPLRRGTAYDPALQRAVKKMLAGFENAKRMNTQEAIADYRAAVALTPAWIGPHYSLAIGLRHRAYKGKSMRFNQMPQIGWDPAILQEADREWSLLIERLPNVPDLYAYRAKVREDLHDYRGALADHEAALRIDPDHKQSHNNIGWLLAACADDQIRNGEAALRHAEQAVGQPPNQRWIELGLLAAANAELGRFDEAVKLQRQSMEVMPANDETGAKVRLDLYLKGQPYRRYGPPEPKPSKSE
jgi:tetratricopeptide (TPR) repeat protein